MSSDYLQLPADLPQPQDDGAADHLPGTRLPALSLPASDGRLIDLSQQPGLVVVYAYPMTGRPGVALPEGWDAVPGARGCTPQSCAYRDSHASLIECGAMLFGLSVQDTAYQQELVERLHLPFPILSDRVLALATAMRLPTFDIAGMRLLRRLTWIAEDGVIQAVHYPVFPSDADAAWVLDYLRARNASAKSSTAEA